MVEVATKRSKVAPLAVAVALLVAAALVLILGGSGSGGGATAATSGIGGTGTVERRTLAERLTATGTIGYAGETTVLARLGGTVTALPAVGDTIGRGERLYGVAGRPVTLMYGAVPAYRDLAEGVGRGRDVEQLERNLKALGFDPGPVDGDFTPEAGAAVRAWQEATGQKVTGEVELGRVAFLAGPQRVSALEATLGEGLRRNSPPVLRTSSTQRVVSVELKADQQSIGHRGQRVEVVLPGGGKAPGRVRGVVAVEPTPGASPPGEETEPGFEATVALIGTRQIPALDGASVNVLFTQRVRRDVLSVPLTALLAIGGERFAVDVVEGSARRRLVVNPGLAADGYAEVSGRGLRAGMTVETGR